jgi:hypothetical protein
LRAYKGEEARSYVIHHDAGPLRQSFQLTHRRRLQNVEDAEQQK